MAVLCSRFCHGGSEKVACGMAPPTVTRSDTHTDTFEARQTLALAQRER